MNPTRSIAMAIFLVLLPSQRVHAELTAKVWIHVEGGGGNALWKARALEEVIRASFAQSTRIAVIDGISPGELDCKEERMACWLGALKARAVDILVLADVDEERMRLQSFETGNGKLVAEKDLPLTGTHSLEELRHQVFRLVKPVIQIGGILDQQAALVRQEQTEKSGLGAVGGLLWYFTSGVAWALALMFTTRITIPKIRRMDQVSFLTLFPLLKAWVQTALLKLFFFVAVLSPFLSGALGLSRALALNEATVWALIVPLSLLLGCLLFPRVVAVLKAGNSRDPSASSSKRFSWVWFKAQKYFSDSLMRSTLDVGEIFSQKPTRMDRRVRTAVSLVLVLCATVVLIRQSLRYHPVYLQRMEHLKQTIEERQKRMQQENHNGRK